MSEKESQVEKEKEELKSINIRIPADLYRMGKLHSFLTDERLTQLVIRLLREEFERVGYADMLDEIQRQRTSSGRLYSEVIGIK